jgi:hypothetical protein
MLTVQLHEMAHSDLLPDGTQLDLTLAIDGVTLLELATRTAVLSENSGVTNRVEFSIVGLRPLFSEEAGNGTTERTVTLTVGAPRESPSFWVWGTTEVPAGITFNPLSPAGTRFEIDATG